jgi:hypothetical protein
MEKIFQKYEEKVFTPSDINEHLPVLKQYGDECKTITEMGVRSIVSTWAFLASNPRKLISLDINNPSQFGSNIDEVYELSEEYGIDFKFIEESSLTYNMPLSDLLFIDTWHDFLQLKQELYRHHKNTRKYIILHDTNTFGYVDESFYDDYGQRRVNTNLPKGLCPAIDEFLFENKEWVLWERRPNNNGLTILKRILND